MDCVVDMVVLDNENSVIASGYSQRFIVDRLRKYDVLSGKELQWTRPLESPTSLTVTKCRGKPSLAMLNALV